MRRFPSRELPENWAEFRDDLILAYSEDSESFSFSNPHLAVKKIAKIAVAHEVQVFNVRGLVEFPGWSIDRNWAGVGENEEDLMVIDLTLPLKNSDFVEGLKDYLLGYIDSKDISDLLAGSNPEELVIGEIPEKIQYIGDISWSQKSKISSS